jgi:hypothetical protein
MFKYDMSELGAPCYDGDAPATAKLLPFLRRYDTEIIIGAIIVIVTLTCIYTLNSAVSKAERITPMQLDQWRGWECPVSWYAPDGTRLRPEFDYPDCRRVNALQRR